MHHEILNYFYEAKIGQIFAIVFIKGSQSLFILQLIIGRFFLLLFNSRCLQFHLSHFSYESHSSHLSHLPQKSCLSHLPQFYELSFLSQLIHMSIISGSTACILLHSKHKILQKTWQQLHSSSSHRDRTPIQPSFGLLIKLHFSIFYHIRLGQVRLGEVWLGQVRLGQGLGLVRLGYVRLGLVRLGYVKLGLVRLGQVRLGQARLGQARLGKVKPGQVR